MSDNILFTSLAELAAQNTDDISVLRSRLQKAGIYIVAFSEVSLAEVEQTDPTQDRRLALTYKGIVEFYEPLEGSSSEETTESINEMLGKNYTQRETMWMADPREAIGLVKGRHVSAHLPVRGNMGGVEGVPEGWLDYAVGRRVAIRVRHAQRGEDTRVYYDWLGHKALTKLGISWEEIGREALDKDGNPIDIAA